MSSSFEHAASVVQARHRGTPHFERTHRNAIIRMVSASLWMIALLSNSNALWANDIATPTSKRTNVVLFLVDDLGWADLGCYGSTFHETPQIDALAASSVQFRQAYAACPVCSPTRASILTGRHPVRVGITDWIPGMAAERVPDRRFQHVTDLDELPLKEITIAELLKSAGYQTWFLGKWHLGDQGHYPTDQGFDINIGGCDKGSPPGGYYSPWKNPQLSANRDNEYLTTRLTDEAVTLINTNATDQPFFMMLSYYNVHTPITADNRTIDHFRTKAKTLFGTDTADAPLGLPDGRGNTTRSRQDSADYASMVAAVDTSVGRVLNALQQSGADDDTLILFFSDNGGLATRPNPRGRQPRVGPTSNQPLRSGKGWLYEGGIREPMLIRLPPSMTPGRSGRVCDAIALSTDLAPTILDVVGLPASSRHVDGISLLPVLQGNHDALAAANKRTIYWHYPHYHGSGWRPGAAVRSGRYKLIEFYEEDICELYDLQTDPGEQHNLAADRPTQRDQLRQQLRQWQTQLAATMPTSVKNN
ncbi:MAG: sulfatase [Planctomycetota bacterium]